jgi:hypothetical protein
MRPEKFDDSRVVSIGAVGHAVDPARRAALVGRLFAERVRCSGSCPVGTTEVL